MEETKKSDATSNQNHIADEARALAMDTPSQVDAIHAPSDAVAGTTPSDVVAINAPPDVAAVNSPSDKDANKQYNSALEAHTIIAVGASAGGLEAIKQLISALPGDIGKPVCLLHST
ncbi:MAG: hypothetical protein JJU41_05165 [Bacteroidetes bacterium]|nr:hypothetical protein [Bacteroidota bacterium]